MRIVIDIDEDYVKIINKNGASNYPEERIVNGIKLPKGHGRLGDLDKLEKEMSNGIKAGLMIGGYEKYPNINNMDDCVECVKYADTIIDADKTKREVK